MAILRWLMAVLVGKNIFFLSKFYPLECEVKKGKRSITVNMKKSIKNVCMHCYNKLSLLLISIEN